MWLGNSYYVNSEVTFLLIKGFIGFSSVAFELDKGPLNLLLSSCSFLYKASLWSWLYFCNSLSDGGATISDFCNRSFGSAVKTFLSKDGAFFLWVTLIRNLFMFFLFSCWGMSVFKSGVDAGAGFGPGLLLLEIFSIWLGFLLRLLTLISSINSTLTGRLLKIRLSGI